MASASSGRTVADMAWIRYYPLRAAVALAGIILLAGAVIGVVLSSGSPQPRVTNTAAQGADLPPQETLSVNRPVTLPPFVGEFVERLNQVNAYVSIGSNESKSDALYRELWRWAGDGGVEVYGLTGTTLTDKLTTADGHKVLELVTLEGAKFCVAEATRLDRRAADAPYLYQGVYLEDCTAMLADPLIR